MRITLITLNRPVGGLDPYESPPPAWVDEQDDNDFEWIPTDEQGLKGAILQAKGDYIAILHPHEELAQTQTIAKIKASLKMTRFDLVYGDVGVQEEEDDDDATVRLRAVKDAPLQIPFSFGHIFMNRQRLLSRIHTHDMLDPKDMIADFITCARTALYLRFPVTKATLRLARFKRSKDLLTCKPAHGSRRIMTPLTRGMVMVLPFVSQPVNDQPQRA